MNDIEEPEEQNLIEALREAAQQEHTLVPKTMLLDIADTLEAQEQRIDKLIDTFGLPARDQRVIIESIES